jgi:UDP-3-O-[3-hydroxymyristoyl] glucosamine N-acyltransferase
VGDTTIVTPQSGVAHDIGEGQLVSGSPAVDHKAWLKYSAILPKLPELVRALRGRKTKED